MSTVSKTPGWTRREFCQRVAGSSAALVLGISACRKSKKTGFDPTTAELEALRNYLKGQPISSNIKLHSQYWTSAEIPEIAQKIFDNGWRVENIKSAKKILEQEARKISLPIEIPFLFAYPRDASCFGFQPYSKNKNYIFISLNTPVPHPSLVGRIAKHELRHAKELLYFRKLFHDNFYVPRGGYPDRFSLRNYALDAFKFLMQKANESADTRLREAETKEMDAVANSLGVTISLMEIRVWATGDKNLDREAYLGSMRSFIWASIGEKELSEDNLRRAVSLKPKYDIIVNLVANLVCCEQYGIENVKTWLERMLADWFRISMPIRTQQRIFDSNYLIKKLYKLFRIQWIIAERHLKAHMG